MYEAVCLHPSFNLKRKDNKFSIKWHSLLKNVFVVNKLDDPVVIDGLKAVVYFLLKYLNTFVFLEDSSLKALRSDPEFARIVDSHLRDATCVIPEENDSVAARRQCLEIPDDLFDVQSCGDLDWLADTRMVNPMSGIIVFGSYLKKHLYLTDMIICIGGDGTLLHVASIFQDTVPPVLSFYMGSLGFLTPFNFNEFPKVLRQFYTEGGPCILRSRLCCKVVRRKTSDSSSTPEDENIKSGPAAYNVLNETSFFRGTCPYLSNLVLSVDDKVVTRIQADGLIVSTPTGSTAYSMSAGASILNPGVPAILITPINPHSLSCRPLVLPMSTTVEVAIGEDSRGECMHLSNDGRLHHRHIIHKGDRVLITASQNPVPCFTSDSPVADWFRDLANCLNWNARHLQNQVNHSRFGHDAP